MLRSALDSKLIYRCEHEREQSLRIDLLVMNHVRDTLRREDEDDSLSSPMENETPMTDSSERTQETAPEQSSLSDSTIHKENPGHSSLTS